MNRQKMIDTIDKFVPDGISLKWCGDLADAIIADQGDEAAEFHVRRNAPDTSKAVSDKIRKGSLQDEVLRLFEKGYQMGMVGFSDDEIEVALNRSHQSVSGARNTLVRKGYVVDSGERRPNRYGNMAIRWTYTGKRVAE